MALHFIIVITSYRHNFGVRFIVQVKGSDVVLAKKGGVVFIPAQYLEDLVLNSEFVMLRDAFGHQRLREGKYTPGEIDQAWTDEIKKDFQQWLGEQKNLPMTKEELDAYMKERNW